MIFILTIFAILMATTFYHYFIEYKYLVDHKVSRSELIHTCYTSIYISCIIGLFHNLVDTASPNLMSAVAAEQLRDQDRFVFMLQISYSTSMAITAILIALSLKSIILKHVQYKRVHNV